MKKLEDLKSEILNNQINNFYVFYGEDFGIRKHYINKIAEGFTKITYLDTYESIYNLTLTKGLFKIKELFVIYEDQEFLKLREDQYKTFLDRLQDYTVIFIYETLAKEQLNRFADKVTYFPNVKSNIALEFVEDEVNLILKNEEDLAFNCRNDYNTILLESDKIKNYANYSNISEQMAYDELVTQNQLLKEEALYDCNLFIDNVLTLNKVNLAYLINLISKNYREEFWKSINRIFNDFLIAYLIKAHNRWKGSSIAYSLGLPWYRTKQIRELEIKFDKDYLLLCLQVISNFDVEVKQGRLKSTDVFDRFIDLLV